MHKYGSVTGGQNNQLGGALMFNNGDQDSQYRTSVGRYGEEQQLPVAAGAQQPPTDDQKILIQSGKSSAENLYGQKTNPDGASQAEQILNYNSDQNLH